MSQQKRVTGVTRRNIFDFLSMSNLEWSGRLEEDQFVARVWPDAAKLPSYDYRFKGALADIRQHRINNDDWEHDWIFTDERFNLMGCADSQFLAFLAELVHPVVRPNEDQVDELVSEFNRQLRPDGYALNPASYISGRPIYVATSVTASHSPTTALNLPTRTLLEDHTALQDHLGAIGRYIMIDPAGAITSAKDLVETLYKLILDKRGVTYATKDDLPSLYKKVARELGVDTRSVTGSSKGSEAVYKTLGGLSSALHGLAELRNQLGRGHGRTTASPALERHARLAFNTAVTLAEFLYDTLQDREGR